MVDWKYEWFFPVRLDHRAHLLATKFLEGGPGLRSNRTIWRLDLFHHAQSKAQRSLPSVPPLLRVPPALLQGTRLDSSGLTSLAWSTLFHRARKKEGLKFSTKSQWKSFGKVLTIFCGLQMILQLVESRSAVTQILPVVEKIPKKRVLVLNARIR